jgi:hypothetical protein
MKNVQEERCLLIDVNIDSVKKGFKLVGSAPGTLPTLLSSHSEYVSKKKPFQYQ